MKTSILAMKSAKWLQTATSTTKLNIIPLNSFDSLVLLASLGAAKFRVCEVCPLGPGVLPVPKHHSKPAKLSSRIILSSTFWRLEAGRKDKEAEVKRGGGGVTMGESAFCYKDNHIFFDPLERVWKYWQYDYIKEEGMVYM